MSPAAPVSGWLDARQVAIVTARNEADRISATVAALSDALPGIHVIVADDGSSDDTSLVAMRAGAEVVARGRPHGKGGAASAAALSVLEVARRADPPTFLFCDGDLGSSAGALATLVDAVESDRCDLAVAAFSRRQGGGFGLAVGFARWAIRNLTGRETGAPISGQRAMTATVLQETLPFAPGFGMEVGMTVDALRAGHELCELELELEHRSTGRTPGGFLHRGKQLRDFVRVYLSRKLRRSR
ncbi:MAG: glycosyltransferase [Solirubrobacterales bacterium]